MPSLTAMRAFEAAGRHECFTKAAHELSVTQSAISRQIKLLEDQLGIKVFVRKGRNVKLSPEGRELHEVVVDAFGRLADGARTARHHNSGTSLIVCLDPVFAVKWFAPRLVSLIKAHPEIDLRLSTAHQGLDPRDENFDAAILYSEVGWSNVESEELFREEVFPVCSPDVAFGEQPLKIPSDLETKTLLHGSLREDWRLWLREANCPRIDPSGGLRFSDEAALIQAAISGAGVALGRSLLVANDLASNNLVEPFNIRMDSSQSIQFIVPGSRPAHPHLEVFRSWLRNALANRSSGLAAGEYRGNSGDSTDEDKRDEASGSPLISGSGHKPHSPQHGHDQKRVV